MDPFILILIGKDGSLHPRPFERECLRTGLKTRLSNDEMDEVMPVAFPDGDQHAMARELSLGRSVENKNARYSFFPESRVPSLRENTKESAMEWLQAMTDADLSFRYDMRAEDIHKDGDKLFIPEEATIASAVMHEVINLIGAETFKTAEEANRE